MYTFDFNHKLKQLNPKLYVDLSTSNFVAPGIRATSILFREQSRQDILNSFQRQYADSKTQGYVQALEAGHLDRRVGGCSTDWVPEYDMFDLDTGALLMRGWRSTVNDLVRKGVCTLSKARSIFSRSLGENRYDAFTYEQKLQKAREDAGYEVEKRVPLEVKQALGLAR